MVRFRTQSQHETHPMTPQHASKAPGMGNPQSLTKFFSL